MKEQEPQFSPNELFAELKQEVEAVTSGQRFLGFVLKPDLKTQIDQCFQLFVDATQDKEFLQLAKKTLGWLRNSQRAFFASSVPKHFDPIIDRLMKSGMDQDLVARARKFVNAVRAVRVHFSSISLTEAGEIYNAAYKAIEEAKDEFRRRVERRQHHAAVADEAARQRAREATEAARQAQLEQTRQERQAMTAGLIPDATAA